MNKLSFSFYRNLLWLWDIIALNGVIFITSLALERADALNKREYHLLFAIFNLSWMSAQYLTTLYLSKNWLDVRSFIRRTALSYIAMAFMVMSFIFIYHFPFSRVFITTFLAGFAGILLLNRIVFSMLIFSLRDQSLLAKNIVLLGFNEQSMRLINYFEKESKLVKVSACFDDQVQKSESLRVPVMGSLKDCMPYVIANDINEIYSTLAPEQYPYIYKLVKDAEKHFVHVKFVPDYHAFVNRNVFVNYIDDMPILSLRREPLEDTGNRIIKRAFDILASALVIVFVLSWLLPLLALIIRLDSRGPVFFRQPRSGKNNRTFYCLKLRSLHVNKEANIKQVIKGDKRITRIGHFLRLTSIDELPQFFNILMGDMSIVGPRPHMLKHTEDFSRIYQMYMIRHFVKPGLTGWAQVNNLRGEILSEEYLRKRVEYDMWYMENWSFWLDMKIVLLTIWLTVRGNNKAFLPPVTGLGSVKTFTHRKEEERVM